MDMCCHVAGHAGIKFRYRDVVVIISLPSPAPKVFSEIVRTTPKHGDPDGPKNRDNWDTLLNYNILESFEAAPLIIPTFDPYFS